MFTHSLNVTGSEKNKTKFAYALELLGYKTSEHSSLADRTTICVNENQTDNSTVVINGEYSYFSKGLPRDFEFDLDTDFDLALAMAAQKEGEEFYRGEWVILDEPLDNHSPTLRYSEFYTTGNLYQLGGRHFSDGHPQFYTVGDNTAPNSNNGHWGWRFHKALPGEIIQFFKKQDKKVMSTTKSTFTVGGSKFLKKAFLEELAEEIALKLVGSDPISTNLHIFSLKQSNTFGYGNSRNEESIHYTLPADYESAKAAFREWIKPEEIKSIEIPLGEGKYVARVYKDYVTINGSGEKVTFEEIEKLLNPNQLFEGVKIFDYNVRFANPAIQIGCTTFTAPELAAVKQAFDKLNA